MADENAEKNRNDRPNAMDVYNFLWRGRDFELSHLWQRSVFLAVFLLGIASAYGVYFKDVFLEQFKVSNCSVNACTYMERSQIFIFGVVPILITILGIIFSKLWIMMAKGSKSWQEIYEDSIAKVNDTNGFWDDESIKRIYGYEINNLIFGELRSAKKPDKCLFSTEGGEFSVSKINVMIGIVFLFVFSLLFLGHTWWALYASKDMFSKLRIPMCLYFCVAFFIAIIAILLVFWICYCIERKVLSSYWKSIYKIKCSC